MIGALVPLNPPPPLRVEVMVGAAPWQDMEVTYDECRAYLELSLNAPVAGEQAWYGLADPDSVIPSLAIPPREWLRAAYEDHTPLSFRVTRLDESGEPEANIPRTEVHGVFLHTPTLARGTAVGEASVTVSLDA